MKEMGKIGNDVKAKFYFERASDNQDSYAQLQLAKFYRQKGNQDLEVSFSYKLISIILYLYFLILFL